MAPTDIVDYPRHRVMPDDPNRRLSVELSYFSGDLRAHLADVIRLFAKERAGFKPYLAIDFEILHGFLFPTIQSRASRVSPALVSYVIENWPYGFLLPPGALIELLRFAEQSFPLMAHLDNLRRSAQTGGVTSRATLIEAIRLYNDIADGNNAELLTITPTDESARTIIEFVSHLAAGFERLNQLLQKGRITSASDINREWPARLEIDRELISAIAAQLSAVQRPSSRRSQRSNYNDALNIAWVLTLEQLSDISDSRRAFVQLLTETRSILHLNLSEYGRDSIVERLRDEYKIMADFADQSRLAWFTSTVSSAALYCAFRVAYGDLEKCWDAAQHHYIKVSELRTELLQIDRLFDQADRGAADLGQRLAQITKEILIDDGAGRWYMPFRVALQNSSVEAISRDSVENSMRGGVGATDVIHTIAVPLLHREHLGRGLSAALQQMDADAADVLKTLGVSVPKSSRKGSLFPRQDWIASSDVTGELLLKIQRWLDRPLVSVEWPVRLELDASLECCLSILRPLAGHRGSFIAGYDVSPEAFSRSVPDIRANEPTCRTLFELSSVPVSLGVQSLIVPGGPRDSELFLLPSYLAIESEFGDLHLMTPYSIDPGGPIATCNVRSMQGFERLLKPMLQASHAWGWASVAIGYFLDEIRKWVSMVEHEGGDSHAVPK